MTHGPSARRRVAVVRALAAIASAAGLIAAAQPAVARTLNWSGYAWDVRNQGLSEPGPNTWSDSPANVVLDGSSLVLSIAKDAAGRWNSAEIDNQRHLGYGTYRWVVETDLSTIDGYEVLGMFTWGDVPPSNNEIDIEAARWGNLAWPSGSGTVWQDFDRDRSQEKTFSYSNRPPYVNQFTWEPGRVTYRITDATGAVLFDWVVTSGVPAPSTEVPMINYWRFENRAPAAPKSIRLSSFTFTPPGATPTPPASPTPTPTPSPRPTPAPAPAPTAIRFDRSGPRIRIASPPGRTYRRGAKLTLRFSCRDASGVKTCTGTLRSPGRRRVVASPTTVRLVHAGTYRLRVRTTDTLGNQRTTEVAFRVIR